MEEDTIYNIATNRKKYVNSLYTQRELESRVYAFDAFSSILRFSVEEENSGIKVYKYNGNVSTEYGEDFQFDKHWSFYDDYLRANKQ